MIIHHKEWGGNNVKHEEKTVRDFINKIIMKNPNKEKKYFRICAKQWLDGKGNMLLYFQDGILKSHHSGGDEFNYKDILEYELHEYYSIDDLSVDNIRSVDCDNNEQLEQRMIAYRSRERSWHTDDMINGMEALERELKEEKIKKTIKEDNIKNDDLVLVVRQLCVDMEIMERMERKQLLLEKEIAKLEEENEKQSQQIIWLGKKF